MPAGYPGSARRVLYVGKATSGNFDRPNEEEQSFNGRGSFWSFAQQIAKGVGCDDHELSCVAWSNISKISYPEITAEKPPIADFDAIASSTLAHEITRTDPHVIIFVTHHFSDAVVNHIAEAADDSAWAKSEDESSEIDIWWRRRGDGRAIVWMGHPERKSMGKLDFAAAKIASLCP